MSVRTRRPSLPPRRGTVLIAVVVALIMLQIVVAAVVVGGTRDFDVSGRRIESARCFYAAEAGVNMALREMVNNSDEDADGGIGSISDDGNSANDPNLSGGRVVVTADKVATTTTLGSYARSGQAIRTLEVTAEDTTAAQSFGVTGIGTTYTTFAQLQTGYTTFIGATTGIVQFTAQAAGEIVTNQYTVSQGVTFSNTAGTHGSRIEEGTVVGVMNGYDGTYRPSGDRIYISQPNTSAITPFTFVYTTAVGRVGSFVGMGPEGATATLTVKFYDASDNLLDTLTITTAAWSNAVTREGFWAYQSSSQNIKKVTIQNDSSTANADRLIFDELIWSNTPSAITRPRIDTWAELIAP
jgi:hypothetical protein